MLHDATSGLLNSGREKIAKKVVEESAEVSLAHVQINTDDVIRKTAELLYNLGSCWFIATSRSAMSGLKCHHAREYWALQASFE